MGAAVAVADVDADGRPDLYVTNSKEGSKNRLYRNRGDGTFEDVAGQFGVADLNRPETGVSMGAVFGDYDNDGFEDLLLYRWGRPELFHNEGGQPLHARDRGRRAAGVGQRQHRDLARLRSRRPARPVPGRLLSGTRQSLEARRHEDHAGELRVREQRRPEVPVPQPRRRAVRGGQREGRLDARRAGRWPRSRPICAARAIPISSSPTTTASRSSSSTRAAGSAKSDARPASASRRRAA